MLQNKMITDQEQTEYFGLQIKKYQEEIVRRQELIELYQILIEMHEVKPCTD